MKTEEACVILQNAITEGASRQNVSFDRYVSELIGYSSVYLYGAGAFGREMLSLLVDRGIHVKCFLDQNASTIRTHVGLPVLLPISPELSASAKRYSTVVVSIVLSDNERKAVFKSLNSLGFPSVVDGQSIRAWNVPFAGVSFQTDYNDEAWISSMKTTLSLFSDDSSREVYTKNLAAHFRRDYSFYGSSASSRQYFPQDVPLSNDHNRFIDCGAYTGDTLVDLMQVAGAVESYVGFEPEMSKFHKLVSTANALIEKPKQMFLFPCAITHENRSSCITTKEGSSTLSESGESITQVVCIDDVLHGFKPTFIKMDIEGAEMDALRGARQTIQTSLPDLAICVYHNISDYFEIPLLIHSMNPKYKFYLRAHSSCTMETVLYATN